MITYLTFMRMPVDANHYLKHPYTSSTLVLQRDSKSCYTRKPAQEQPEEPDEELKVSTWLQNPPNPELIELRGTWLKINNPWSSVGMRGFTLSAAMFE